MLRAVSTTLLAVSFGSGALLAQATPVLRWAGDAEGGAPYVEADPADPSGVVGFDVEVAQLIAKGLGRTPRFVEVSFTSIDQSIARGDADIGLSERRRIIDAIPDHRGWSLCIECGDLFQFLFGGLFSDHRIDTQFLRQLLAIGQAVTAKQHCFNVFTVQVIYHVFRLWPGLIFYIDPSQQLIIAGDINIVCIICRELVGGPE